MHGLPHELHLHMVQRLLGLPALCGLDLVPPHQVLQKPPALFLLPQKQIVLLLQLATAVRFALLGARAPLLCPSTTRGLILERSANAGAPPRSGGEEGPEKSSTGAMLWRGAASRRM
jgi:hypothetical protein